MKRERPRKKLVTFVSHNEKPSSLTFNIKLNQRMALKTYYFEHNKIYNIPEYVIEHVNRAGKNNIPERDKFEVILIKEK